MGYALSPASLGLQFMDVLEEAVDGLARQYERDYDRREAQAERDQRILAAQNQSCRPIKGLGELKMEIPSSVAKDWMEREGPDVLRDPDFIRYQKRKNPHMFARQEKRGNRVGYGS